MTEWSIRQVLWTSWREEVRLGDTPNPAGRCALDPPGSAKELSDTPLSLRERLEAVRGRVARAAERSGRPASEIRMIAVSKTMAPEVVLEAYHLGQREFGENRVQEFRDKRRALAEWGEMPGARWHMIGHLQSNKAKLSVELFDIIQSVDSAKLATLLHRNAEEMGRRLPVLLQVDFSSLPQRSGFTTQELESMAAELVALPHLEIQGLMTVAPLGLDEESLRSVFRRLRLLRDRLAVRYPEAEWRHLSMGMSDDFEVAIEEGSTIVRIGRAIFGDRPHQ